MLDPDLFKHLEEWSSMGDVLATVEWQEVPGPIESYSVSILWRFRGDRVGEANYLIHPMLNTDDYHIFWVGLRFVPEWQGKHIYSNLVQSYAQRMPSYGVVGVITVPQDAEAERRLASQGFKWDGHEFYLDFARANES